MNLSAGGVIGDRRTLIVAFAAIAIVATGCGRGGGPEGRVVGDGSSTVFPITEAVAEEFGAVRPRVRVTVGVSGTGGGFSKFCNGETDFNDASRPIKDTEEDICERNEVRYEEFTVAVDGLAVVVNPENTWADCLTTDELATIWGPRSEGKVRSWADVRDGFPDVPLRLFGPGTDSGTFDYFTEAINGEEGASRTDYTASEDDNIVVTGVGGDTGALGYFGFAYYAENADKLKVISVDGGDGCVEPSDETVKSNEYAPLSRPLFVYVREDAAADEAVAQFFSFYLEVANDLVADVGYTPLADELLLEQIEKWEAMMARAAGGAS